MGGYHQLEAIDLNLVDKPVEVLIHLTREHLLLQELILLVLQEADTSASHPSTNHVQQKIQQTLRAVHHLIVENGLQILTVLW